MARELQLLFFSYVYASMYIFIYFYKLTNVQEHKDSLRLAALQREREEAELAKARAEVRRVEMEEQRKLQEEKKREKAEQEAARKVCICQMSVFLGFL